MESTSWNPWHGCTKISPGCLNCYMFSMDAKYDKLSTILTRNSTFNAPLRVDRYRNYKMEDEQTVYTCLTSDFFHEDADKWREEAWQIVKQRQGLMFFIFTKRTNLIPERLPSDWKDGYENVTIGVSCENQEMLDKRAFEILALPVKHRAIVCSPLLEEIDISQWVSSGGFESVIVGGESAVKARLCRYDWILKIREQCVKYHVDFMFQQTGTLFEKGGKQYKIFNHSVQKEQAVRAGINTGRFD